MSTSNDPKPPPPPEVTPAEPVRYKPHQKTFLRKGGEAVTQVGQGAASLSAIQTGATALLDKEATAASMGIGAVFFLAGLVFIYIGVYLQAEADR